MKMFQLTSGMEHKIHAGWSWQQDKNTEEEDREETQHLTCIAFMLSDNVERWEAPVS